MGQWSSKKLYKNKSMSRELTNIDKRWINEVQNVSMKLKND